ncbi:MAG TPA: glycerol kinase GlpK [Candidatus Fimadaptatus faecigallinarum]|uniref:Glycerol kinase n=1 Tax=Candidatus Fimadaptatus faecigallinarum TaxID=2840814 RepID=A0A9D1LR03_9FIRM|nr:glycerol kinase GlpK [Candidatus Fimadaptatus faecigallinarum]
MKYVVALDQGTTSSRAVVFDELGNAVASHGIEFKQIYPNAGWVEHSPTDILDSQIQALKLAVEKSGVPVNQIAAIGITNQRETTLVWDRATGKPVYNAIVWQCRRTASLVERLKRDGLGNTIREKTGLIPDAYFAGTKVQWILDNVPDARERAERGELCFGTVDSFLAWHLTGGAHVTDATNAGRTMLFNIHTQNWDELLLRAMDIPESMMPEVCDSASVVGLLRKDILGVQIPVAALMGDQSAALFGQGCFGAGMMKNTYGTGCFLLMNTGKTPVRSQNNLLTTVAWRINGQPYFALEGSVFVAGAVVQWLRDEMKLVQTAADTDMIAQSVPDNGGVYLVPAFTGLGAPYWDMYGRGTVVGLTRGTGRAHFVRAALESIAYQTRDVVDAMKLDADLIPEVIRVDGGASANNFLMQFQADILGTRVLRPAVIETTALGAAMMAGLAVGIWDQKQLNSLWRSEREFRPMMDGVTRLKLYQGWQRAVERARGWVVEQQ